MQQLHLVGFTADNRGLIFSPRKGSKSGGFVVDLDDRLLARVDEVIARREEEDGARSNRPSSNLSPREIQARLRAGRTIAQVAREAGVEEEWVARWAAPIQAEQGQVVQRAQGLILQKNRVGPSAVELGEAVRWNMADKGIVFTDAGWSGSWDAFHLREDTWVVRFSYVHRKRTNQAEWEVDIPSATLTSRNRQGTELGYVAPGRKRPKPPRTTLVNPAPPAPVAPAPKPEPIAKPEPKKPAKRRRPAAKKSPAKRAAKKSTAKKSTAKKSAAQKKAAQKSLAKKAPAKKRPAARKAPAKAIAKSSPPKSTATKRSATKRAAGRKSPAKKARPAARKKAVASRPAARKAPGTKPPAARPEVAAATVRPSTPPPVAARPSSRPAPVTPKPTAPRPSRPAAPRQSSARPKAARSETPRSEAPREIEGFPRPATRTPIRIDSGVPRREPASPIIRADRASEGEGGGEPATAGNGSAPATGRQGRFRFRRGRAR